MEIKEITLKELEERRLDNYRRKFPKLEKRRFVDFTHDGTGTMCTMYHNPRTKKYELEVI